MDGGLFVIVGVPVLRSVAGWLTNALEDNKIDFIEWKKLGTTVLRLGVPALALYYGFALDASLAAAIPLVFDYAIDFGARFIKKTNE